ncbi:MAG: nucleotidyltransferase [Cellulosilyticaceae bacterium]
MRIVGIVVEYNPFHNGHLYQIEEIKRQLNPDGIIVVMSGQFTQRGMPCITDKHSRSQMALANGVDMVLELPVPFATASAEFFATAAVSLLHKTGIVTHLSFGCEHPTLDLMHHIATTLSDEPLAVSSHIKEQLAQGVSYPRARQDALVTYLTLALGTHHHEALEQLLSNPNNILGIQYLTALKRLQSPIQPLPIQRTIAGYHDTSIHHRIASATAIRNHLKDGDQALALHALPEASANLLFNEPTSVLDLNDFSDLLHYKLIFSTSEDLYALWDVPKNLCLSLINAAKAYTDIQDIINAVTSKTYSRATVSRAILRILLGIKKDLIEDLEKVDYAPYIRVLACKPESKQLLATLCKNASAPVITQFNKGYQSIDNLSQSLLDLEVNATKLYALKKHAIALATSDFTKSIFTHS